MEIIQETVLKSYIQQGKNVCFHAKKNIGLLLVEIKIHYIFLKSLNHGKEIPRQIKRRICWTKLSYW